MVLLEQIVHGDQAILGLVNPRPRQLYSDRTSKSLEQSMSGKEGNKWPVIQNLLCMSAAWTMYYGTSMAWDSEPQEPLAGRMDMCRSLGQLRALSQR